MIMRNMFEDFKTGWSISVKKNEEGPKKIAEVREEVADKYEAERQAQDASRKNDRGGGRYNNDGDYGNDRRNNNRGDNRNQEQRYQKKDSHNKNQGGIPYGKGGQEKRGGDRNQRDNRNDRNKKQEKEDVVIEEITEEEMCKKVKKNFEEFVLKKQNEVAEPADEDENEEAKEEKPKSEQFDLSLYRTINRKNGKSYEDIFYGLLLRVFDEDIQKVENHFEQYLD